MAAMTISEYSQFFKILSEPVRLRIIYLLLEQGEVCVCDLVNALEISQSVVSRHLSYMRSRGLVSARRDGVWMHYKMAESSGFVRQMLGLLQADARHEGQLKLDIERLKGSSGCCG